MDKISLINHASVLISHKEIHLLTDPWYQDSAFYDGWDLLYHNTENDIDQLLCKVTHIYISHEHPDHFSISFFKKYSTYLIERKVIIFIQKTRDLRIYNFLNNLLNLTVIEIENNSWSQISKTFKFKIFFCGVMDSSLIIETDQAIYLNFNDCDFSKREIKSQISDIDPLKPRILLIQFSYAAWRSDRSWLRNAAHSKLTQIKSLAQQVRASLTIPFASFIFFSHQENFWLNSCTNSPKVTSDFLTSENIQHAFLPPWPEQFLPTKICQDKKYSYEVNDSGISFWEPLFKLEKFALHPTPNETSEILDEQIDFFLKRIKSLNSFFLLSFIRAISFGKIFGDTTVYLFDSNLCFRLNFSSATKTELLPSQCDLVMHSSSLLLLLSQAYGLDTLSVNGRFTEGSPNGFKRFVFALGFVTLNTSHYGIRPRDLFIGRLFARLTSIPLRILQKNT